MAALAISLLAPVYAHTTIGNLNGSGPLFRNSDHEMNGPYLGHHVPGPLGYVWPGSGLNMYTNSATYPPGYQSPFTTFEQPLQAGANSYAPEGAILTSTSDHDSVGDLIFALNFSEPKRNSENPSDYTYARTSYNYSAITIYVPAPFFDRTGSLVQDGFEPAGDVDWGHGKNTNIMTTITDNCGSIFVTRADQNDPFGPNWWIIHILGTIRFQKAAAHGYPSEQDYKEWYYIRINQMKAPFVAGRYFFKIFLNSSFPVRSYDSTKTDILSEAMPMENWPVLLVKGEVDPGIISGTVRYGDAANDVLYGNPLSLPGKIRAVGFASDPVTGELTGRAVEARGYFNGSAKGHFEIEGVAPGVYDVFASTAGYPEQKIAENVRIFRGQSLTLDAYLKVGPEIRGEVFSKDRFGLASWPGNRPLNIVIYDSDKYDPESIVTYSPMNLTHAPFTSYVTGNVVYDSSSGYTLLKTSNVPRLVAFPWEGPASPTSAVPPQISWVQSPPATTEYQVTDSIHDPLTKRDVYGLFNGVGPAQTWWVDPNGDYTNGGGSNSFHYQFGIKSYYGAPTKFSGMIPQVFATWTDSLTLGRYYVRVYVNGYVQTTNNGAMFVDCPFVVPDIGFSRDVSIPIDVWRSSTINVTVHFHDLPGTINTAPVRGPDPWRFLIAEALTGDETLAAFNFTQVPAKASQWNITLNGLGMAGPVMWPMIGDLLPGYMSRVGVKYSLARYRGIYDYGLPTDTYAVRVFMRGYIQALPPATGFSDLDQPLTLSVSAGTGVTSVSTHMYRGGGVNVTVFSVDWQRPHVDSNWMWNNASVSARLYDISSAKFVDVIYFWNAKNGDWELPKQNAEFTSLPYQSWMTEFYPGASYLFTNGSTLVDRFGPDVPNSIDKTNVFYQEIFHTGFVYSSISYRDTSYRSGLAIYPGVYAVNVGSYGYVQENVVGIGMDLGNVLVPVNWIGSFSDANVKVMIGVNFTITILFKTEGVFSRIPYNTSVRISVFDEGDTLVAAATGSSNAGSLPSNTGLFVDDGKILETNQTIPAGTLKLECVNLAGFLGYVEPGGDSLRAATLFPSDQGVWGRSVYAGSYAGSWIVMVDFMNWYSPHEFYPPVPALLQGEYPFFFAYNHLGPYRQQAYTKIPNVALGGEVSIVFEVDRRSYIQGIVHGLDWNGAPRTISWASIEFKNEETTYHWYSWDGWFDGYLDPGDYQVTVREWTAQNEGHNSYEFTLNAGTGQVNRAFTILLNLTGIPIPEYMPLPVIVASFAAVMALRRLRRNPRRIS